MLLRQRVRLPSRAVARLSPAARHASSVGVSRIPPRSAGESSFAGQAQAVAASRMWAGHRAYATTATAKFKQAQITEEEYHRLADTCLDALTDSLEALVEEYDGEEVDDFEAEFASGVLNLRLGSHGTYVINKQPPNKQIWFSSPRSGPKRFDFDAQHGAWFMLKDGEESNLRDLLDAELSDVFGKPVHVDLGHDVN